MSLHDRKKAPQALVSALIKTLDRVLGDACDLSWETRVSEDDGTPTDPSIPTTSMALRFGGSWAGEATLVVQTSDLEKLGFKEASAGVDSTRLVERYSDAISGMTAETLKLLEEYGPMTLQAERGLAPDGHSERATELILKAGESGAQLSIYLYCDSNLAASVQMSSSKSFSFPEATPAANLDLVLDVALNVTLRFGQRQLALREVLDLTSGSVVELDRQVDEPIELVLDGKVIARGEAVIIDGTYGMRITQVVQPILL